MAAKTRLNNEKGFATIEVTALLVVFVALMGFSIGMFGVVHTGILHSISARTYAFETFRHRTNLVYFRDSRQSAADYNYIDSEIRYHGITAENMPNVKYFHATGRRISFVFPAVEESGQSTDVHTTQIMQGITPQRWQGVGVNPVWVRVQYGICINSSCGEG